MRRFFGKLANVIRQTNKSRPAQGGRRRTSLQVEALETRQLLSTSPVTAVIAAPLNVPPLTPIQFKYQSLGGASGFLGKAVWRTAHAHRRRQIRAVPARQHLLVGLDRRP